MLSRFEPSQGNRRVFGDLVRLCTWCITRFRSRSMQLNRSGQAQLSPDSCSSRFVSTGWARSRRDAMISSVFDPLLCLYWTLFGFPGSRGTYVPSISWSESHFCNIDLGPGWADHTFQRWWQVTWQHLHRSHPWAERHHSWCTREHYSIAMHWLQIGERERRTCTRPHCHRHQDWYPL